MQAIKFVTVAAVMSEVMNKKSFKAQKKVKFLIPGKKSARYHLVLSRTKTQIPRSQMESRMGQLGCSRQLRTHWIPIERRRSL
jgi:hypothetical protein